MTSTLRLGSRGPEVARLQELLNKHLKPHPALRVDGDLGPRTAAAVRNYQAALGIGIDGVVGSQTWSLLETGVKMQKPLSGGITGNFCNAPWMDVARKELGQEELVGSEHNPQILAYFSSTTLRASTDETPWCSAFVNWCLKQVGIQGTSSAAARSWIHWGKPCTPTVGAITVISTAEAVDRSFSSSGCHVGFLLEDTSSHIVLLGGNQRNMVKKSKYPKKAWASLGHRWPN